MTKFSTEHLINVFKNQVKANHRAMFVIVGEDPKQQIHILHGKLNQISNVSNVIWCYKNKNSETPLDKETKKLKNCENDKELEKWIKTYSPEYISYKENSKILGKTCDMLILQDFEALTPNMMACSIETVRGGGAIILLLDLEKSIEIDTCKSELVIQSVNEKSISRFNKRLFRNLVHLPCAMLLDSSLRVIDITNDNIENNKVLMEKEIQITSDKCINHNSALFRMCKTKDQISVLTSLVSHLDIDEPSVSSVIAERGRGKSAALGLAIVCAIEKNFPLVLISSLFLDNVQAIFEFIIAGLDALEYKKMKDYKISYTFESKKRLINKIEVVKDYRRIVEFVQSFEEPKAYPNLLVIDEAASIPLLYLKKLLDVRLVFMASTANGYEGTGRIFRTKLTEYIKEKSIKSYTYEMGVPIRYSIGDEVEDWLYKTLLLGPKISQVEQCPLLSQCSLYYVNKDVLFNGSQKSETFLSEIFSLFVASHYRNSPNDIQTLSDSPSHEIFVLMAPFKPLRIVCAIQVSFEGKCNKNACVKQGNLIPWVIYENFFDDQFLDKLGMRIVRVAVHPSMLSMGYGSLALLTLTNLFIDRHESHSSKSEHNAYTTGEQCSKNSISVDYNPSCIMCDDQSTLFHPINTIKTPNIDWIGSSFGVSERLLNFWKRSNFNPVCIKQTQSKTTGEFSIVLLKAIGNKTDEFDGMKTLFLERFVPLLSYSFKNLSPTLALSLIYSSNAKVLDKKIHFSKDEVNRLTKFSNGLIDIKSIMDILPDLSRSYFYQNDLNKLSVVSQIALLMIGCQRKTVKEVAEYLSLDCFKVINLIISTIGTLLSTDLK